MSIIANSTFRTPSAFQAVGNSRAALGRFFHPFRQDLASAKGFDGRMMLSVSHLFCGRCPSNIAFFIMTIHVLAIKGMIGRWAVSNVCQHFFNRCKKKFNAPFAVVVIAFIRRIFASSLSAVKGRVFSAITNLRQISTSLAPPPISFGEYTPTGHGSFRAWFRHIASNNNLYSSALTLTQPLSQFLRSGGATSGIFKNGQFAELLSSQITNTFIQRRENVRIVVSHDAKVTPFVELVRAALVRLTPLRPVFILPQIGEKSYA